MPQGQGSSARPGAAGGKEPSAAGTSSVEKQLCFYLFLQHRLIWLHCLLLQNDRPFLEIRPPPNPPTQTFLCCLLLRRGAASHLLRSPGCVSMSLLILYALPASFW